MLLSRRALCAIYALIALLALVGTWGNNAQYLSLGFLGANQRFWLDTLVNPASRSITVDVGFLFMAVSVWMLLEGRRLGMKWLWLYMIFGLLVAISVTFPLFMLNRERSLAAQASSASGGQPQQAGHWRVGDVLGLLVLGALTVAYTVHTLQVH